MAWTKPTVSEISVGLEINSTLALKSKLNEIFIYFKPG